VIWRVRGRAAFAALSRAPRATCDPLSVRVLHGSTDAPPRVAFAIPHAVGSAAVRNRVRRRLRAALAADAALLRVGASYLVSARPRAADLTYREIQTALRACVQRPVPA
jgi:ribonuclease P protein component